MDGLEVVEFGSLTAADRADLEGDEPDPFDSERIVVKFSWRAKDRHVGLRDRTGKLVASAGMVTAEAQAGDGPAFAVVGLGGVIVSAAWRGQGLGSRVIELALDRARTLGPPIVMLFCYRDRAGLYARHGFVEIAAPVLVEQPGGLVPMPQITMWRTLRSGAQLPDGRVVLRSLPF